MAFLIPGVSGQVSGTAQNAYEQAAPVFHQYSPRLFGAPPQLTNLCDMRIKSSLGDVPGPVGDFYLDRILRNAQIANFVVGHALFTGGMSSIGNIIRVAGNYAYALKNFDIFSNGASISDRNAAARIMEDQTSLDRYNAAMSNDDGTIRLKRASELSYSSADSDAYVVDLSDPSYAEGTGILTSIANIFSATGAMGALGGISAGLIDSLSVQQPFYTFEADWSTYINNVKMMINTAIMMLGLQGASVRIGDKYYPIATTASVKEGDDVWSNYRFITASDGVGTINGIDNQTGDTHQYVSFMINPLSPSESFTNTTGESQIYASVMKMGSAIGNEIAFITNSSRSGVDDALLELTSDVIGTAEKVMAGLTGSVGRFTASIASSMARSYTGDHAIYPKIFNEHSTTSSVSMTVQLRATAGDPFSYLTEVLVPFFHILAMALPQMSKNAASSYSYPPLVQCNIPGVWGTRLGMITSVSVEKNPDSNDYSINGYPLSMNITITVEDLQHVLMTSGMNQISMMLNNHTMFDYIAQCSGVDKYRVNGSIRVVTRIALAAAAANNTFYDLGHAIMNDAHTFVSRMTGSSRM